MCSFPTSPEWKWGWGFAKVNYLRTLNPSQSILDLEKWFQLLHVLHLLPWISPKKIILTVSHLPKWVSLNKSLIFPGCIPKEGAIKMIILSNKFVLFYIGCVFSSLQACLKVIFIFEPLPPYLSTHILIEKIWVLQGHKKGRSEYLAK